MNIRLVLSATFSWQTAVTESTYKASRDAMTSMLPIKFERFPAAHAQKAWRRPAQRY